MMAVDAFLWLVLGLALQCQILIADTSSNERVNAGLTSHKSMASAIKETGLSKEHGNLNEEDDNAVKMHNEKLKNVMQQKGEEHDFTSEREGIHSNKDGESFEFEHILTKRFTDTDGGYEFANRDDSIDGVGLEGLYALDPYGYYNAYAPDAVGNSGIVGRPIDKRHNSRWSLINRKLAELKGNNKRDNDKRQDSRWLIIQNKLNQLHNRYSKRGIGRWKNNKWSLEKSGEQMA